MSLPATHLLKIANEKFITVIEAAGHIRFMPAERDGRPVESAAAVHIILELAY